MIFFGHLGITTAVVKVYDSISYKGKAVIKKVPIDYRFILLGSILPDIIDKPIGAYFFRSTFHNSRIFAHTLLFSTVLILWGVYLLFKRRSNSVLLLGIGSLIHLILDSMWLYPAILLWPYFGLRFPQRAEGNWIQSNIDRLFTDPTYFLPEIIGFIVIAYYFIKLIKNKKLMKFIKKGEL